MSTLTSLLLAREAAKHSPWVQYRPEHGKWGKDLYHWCSLGWKQHDCNGYGWDVPNALRPYVEGGDLTKWWIQGRSKRDVLDLFKTAAEGLMP